MGRWSPALPSYDWVVSCLGPPDTEGKSRGVADWLTSALSALFNGGRGVLDVNVLGRDLRKRRTRPTVAGLEDSAIEPRSYAQQRPPELSSAAEWRDPNQMGTPASIACDLPHPQAPKSCTRKRASANIFQGVGLLQLHHLFHSTGDVQAEERAKLVWERSGNRCIAQALRQLHRKQTKLRLRTRQKFPSESGSSTEFLELQHFGHLRIEDCTVSYAEDNRPNSSKKPDVAAQGSPRPASYCRQKRKRWGTGAAGYLHQLQQ